MPRSPLDGPRKRLIAALLSGAAISLAEGLHPWWPAAWIAPIPVLVAAFEAPRREAAGLAAIAGAIGCASMVGYYVEVTGPVVTTMIVLGRALELAIVVSVTRLTVVRWRHWLAIFVYPSLFAGLDAVGQAVSRHGSAGSLAYSQMNALAVIQVASIAGTSGIVFIVSLFASAVSVAWYHRANLRHFRTGYALTAAILAIALGFGAARLQQPRSGSSMRIGLAVVDTPPTVEAPSPDNPLWKTYQAAVAELARRGARIVVLPERIAPLTPREAREIATALGRTAENNKIYLLAGIGIVEPDHKENRAWLISPSGEIEADYAKRHLVPGFEDAFRPGGRMVARIIDGRLTGIAICKDMDFPGLGRNYAQQGAQLMLVPAWDFGRDGWLHSRMAILRGVEGGYTIARAARDGLLTISDRYGRVLYQAKSSKRPYAALVADAPLETAPEPLYGVVGNLFGWIALIVAIVISLRAAVTVSLWNWLRAGSR